MSSQNPHISVATACGINQNYGRNTVMKNKSTQYITRSAVIAAVYVLLTFLSAAMGLSGGVIQVRFSEALTILPAFTPAAIPGLFIGCLVSNMITGAVLWDIIFGSIATLIGAVLTYTIRKRNRFLLPLPPIIANTAIIPFILTYAYGMTDGLAFTALTVFIGEAISAGALGMMLYKAMDKPGVRKAMSIDN